MTTLREQWDGWAVGVNEYGRVVILRRGSLGVVCVGYLDERLRYRQRVDGYAEIPPSVRDAAEHFERQIREEERGG